MLRSKTPLLKRTVIAVTVDATSQNAICVQQARSVRPRKPAFLGMAKSKWFRIPSRPEHDPDELKEIVRISNQYRTYQRSLSLYFKAVNESRAVGSTSATKTIEIEEAEWQESLIRIKQWNEEISSQRNLRIESQRKEKEAEIKQRLLEEERLRQEKLKEIEALVRKEKTLSSSYITPENIDAAIAKSLENVVDFNFAINNRGQKFVGRYVNASGEEELPNMAEYNDESSLPPLFQSSPLESGFHTNK